MDIGNMKNIVILKNLPSNMVEEVFVVLKDNIKIHSKELFGEKDSNNIFKEDSNNTKKDGKYIIKEAEMLVADYIDKINKKQNRKNKLNYKIEEKYNKLKYLTIFLLGFSILSTISFFLR